MGAADLHGDGGECVTDEAEFVTVVIPALNEGKHIGACIKSINECGYPMNRFEIVVVDNGSADETPRIVMASTARLLVERTKTIGGLRNFGISEANGTVFAFLDADCTVSYGWLENGVARLRDRQIGLTGCLLGIADHANWLERAWYLHLQSRRGAQAEISYINSGNCFVRKEVFESVAGFSEQLTSGEDVDLCRKIRSKGYRIVEDQRIEAVHWGYPNQILSFIKREMWHGLGSTEIEISHFWRSRPLLLSVYNIIVLGLLVGLWPMHGVRSIAAAILLLLPCIALGLRTGWKVGRLAQFGSLGLLYLLYGVGRSLALLRFLAVRGGSLLGIRFAALA